MTLTEDFDLRWPAERPRAGSIQLRAFEERDVDMVLDLSTDPYVSTIGSLPHRADRWEALAYLERQRGRLPDGAGFSFCVADRDTDEALGGVGLWIAPLRDGRATVGYAVAPRARGRGAAGEALSALMDFAWTIPALHRIELYVEQWNLASIRSAQVAGFERESLLRNHQWIDGQRVDMVLFAVVRR